MLIPCPHCGPRSHEEFTTLGEVRGPRPAAADATGFADYLFLRANVAGRHREHWFHAQGCQSWLVVERDTLTHEIHGVWFTGAMGTVTDSATHGQ
jgi:methylglutamate dehydrogenase subunit B